MTPRCDLCGEFANEETSIHPSIDVCFGCLTDLIDDEIEQLEDAVADHGCSVCGKVGAERSLFVATQGEACDSCIGDLIDNEVERRGVAEQERRFRQYWEGHPTQEDRDRQDLKDAGRGHLT